MFSELKQLCEDLENRFDLISDSRKAKLAEISEYISFKLVEDELCMLNIICTHNSRRSHIGQILLLLGSAYYGLDNIKCYSGGTEATAFNPRVVKALRSKCFQIGNSTPEVKNPLYHIFWSDQSKPIIAFSKKYQDAPNPSDNFAAILVCSEVDQDCPIVYGAEKRFALPFKDPKEYDDSDFEEQAYTDKVTEIGTEMLYILSLVKKP